MPSVVPDKLNTNWLKKKVAVSADKTFISSNFVFLIWFRWRSCSRSILKDTNREEGRIAWAAIASRILLGPVHASRQAFCTTSSDVVGASSRENLWKSTPPILPCNVSTWLPKIIITVTEGGQEGAYKRYMKNWCSDGQRWIRASAGYLEIRAEKKEAFPVTSSDLLS